MRKIYFLFLLIIQFSFAQAPSIQWQKTFGGTNYDYAQSIQQTLDGGYIVAGYSQSNDGDVTGFLGFMDLWIIKLSATGTIQWKKTLGGTDFDSASSIQQTTDGGFIVAGYAVSNNGDVTGNHGGGDIWVVKLSNTGVIQWQKTLGGTGNESAQSIQQTTDGGFIVIGTTTSNDGDVTGNHGGGDIWVVKLSSTGIIEWQKTLGGNGYDPSSSIQQTKDGGYIVAGSTNSNNGDVTGNHGDYDYWVVKLSSAGSIQWQKTFGGSGSDIAYSIKQTLEGGYIVTGYTNSSDVYVTGNHGSADYWIVKLSYTGTIQWQKCLGGSAEDEASRIIQTMDSGYIVSGWTFSNSGDVTGNHGNHDYWVVKLSNSGTVEWQKTLGGTEDDYAYSIQQTTDGGYILAGYSTSNNGDVTGNHGFNDYWIVKLAPDAFSTNNFSESAIKVFPNPTTTILSIQNPNHLTIDKIIITDLAGKTVLQQDQNATEINVDQLAIGMYILQAFSGEEKLVSKFVKK